MTTAPAATTIPAAAAPSAAATAARAGEAAAAAPSSPSWAEAHSAANGSGYHGDEETETKSKAKKKPLLVALDFDYTVVDSDSDHWVLETLAPRMKEMIRELTKTMQWTDLVDHCLGKLHEEDHVTRQQLVDTLATIPFSPAMLEVFQLVKSVGGDIIIISDANTFFIEEILKAKNARQYVSEIVTNPCAFDDAGRLRVRRRVTSPPHGCDLLCAVNLCKGKELIPRMQNYARVLYGGDGRNDYCPATRLSPSDFALFRRGHSLEAALAREPARIERVKAQVVWWDEAPDLLAAVRRIVAAEKEKEKAAASHF
ncbi:putative phosphatase-domain-containing protein [Zopfochytrium polystomum]|nr:putative phosphatase-domain-containing protein [Zopfochytrium polystomum]